MGPLFLIALMDFSSVNSFMNFLMQVNLWYPTTSCGKGLAGFTVS